MDKVSSYDLFVNLIPGIIFAVISYKIFSFPVLQDNIAVDLVVCYFIGLVINSFGSLVLRPVLKKINVLKFEKYEDFICACKNDRTIELLSEKNNMYLTLSSLFFVLTILSIYEWVENPSSTVKEHGILVLIFPIIMLLLLFSYKKQTDYIKKRIKNTKDKRKMYFDLLEPFCKLFYRQNSKQTSKEDIKAYILSEEYRRTSFEVTLIGSDAVVKAHGDLMQQAFRGVNETKKIENLFATLLLELRKDLGHNDTKLTKEDMIRHMIKDIDDFEL